MAEIKTINGIPLADTVSRSDLVTLSDKIDAVDNELSAEKMTHPISGNVGQIIQVEAVDENGRPFSYIAVEKPSQLQSNYEENDNTKPTYILNRPFYTDSFFVVPLDEYSFDDDGMKLYVMLQDTVFETGVTYDIRWNSEELTAVAKEVDIEGDPGVAIGNLAIAELGEDTGEIFLFVYNEGLNETYIYTNEPEPVNTVSVSCNGDVKQLDDKYISSNIQRTYDESLMTDDKTIVGAINEISSSMANDNHNHNDLYDVLGSAEEALNEAKEYTDEAVSQKTQVQIITWGEND